MELFICLLAVFCLAFFIKEMDGPFSLMAWLRNKLITTKYINKFFYDLLSCFVCIGFHCSYVIYLISTPKSDWAINDAIVFSLAGAIFCLFANAVLEKLENN